jgi:hypothetical protein
MWMDVAEGDTIYGAGTRFRVRGVSIDPSTAVSTLDLVTAAPWQVKTVDCATCPDNRAWAVYWHDHPTYPGTSQHMGSFPDHESALYAVKILRACAADSRSREHHAVPCEPCHRAVRDLATRPRRTA